MKTVFTALVLNLLAISAFASAGDLPGYFEGVDIPGSPYKVYKVESEILLGAEVVLPYIDDCNTKNFRARYNAKENSYVIEMSSTVKECPAFSRKFKKKAFFNLDAGGSKELLVYVPKNQVAMVSAFIEPFGQGLGFVIEMK